MPAILTITGTNGSNIAFTGAVFPGVSTFTIDVDKQMISFTRPEVNNQVTTISIPVLADGPTDITVAGNKVATLTLL